MCYAYMFQIWYELANIKTFCDVNMEIFKKNGPQYDFCGFPVFLSILCTVIVASAFWNKWKPSVIDIIFICREKMLFFAVAVVAAFVVIIL